MIYLFAAVATFVTIFGMEGRGVWSRNISVVGGLLWLFVIIYGFYFFPWQKSTSILLGTFVFGAISQGILRGLLNPRGH